MTVLDYRQDNTLTDSKKQTQPIFTPAHQATQAASVSGGALQALPQLAQGWSGAAG